MRPATAADSDFILALRNDPDVRRWSRSKAVIPRRVHEQWYADALKRDSIFIDEGFGESNGYVRIGRGGIISMALVKKARGHGRGFHTLIEALTQDARPRYSACVHHLNVASLVMFLKAGFVPVAMKGSWISMRRMRT